jgi:hypothetical protein
LKGGAKVNSASYVDEKIKELKATGNPLQWVAWNIALLCIGWAYVFGAWGAYCTVKERKYRYGLNPSHETIKTGCKAWDTNNCSGCKWFPGGERTRCFDCRGFTDWVLKQVGFDLAGEGATSQWNTAKNWKAKGKVADGIPPDTLVCLFVQKDGKMSHTGFVLNNETIECSSGVQYFAKRNKKWTHWAVPACVEGEMPPTPTPEPTPATKPTLRRGSKGEYVTLAQTRLIQKGYDCGSFGADGEFGAATEKAVRAFQRDHTDPDTGNPLTVDGVIGSRTWAALDAVEPSTKYTVTIPHLSKSQADALISHYPGSTMTEERG